MSASRHHRCALSYSTRNIIGLFFVEENDDDGGARRRRADTMLSHKVLFTSSYW